MLPLGQRISRFQGFKISRFQGIGVLQVPFRSNDPQKWISQGLHDPFWVLVAKLEFYRFPFDQLIPEMDFSEPERSISGAGCPIGALQAPFRPTDPQNGSLRPERSVLGLVARLELYRLPLDQLIPQMDLPGSR